MLIAQWGLPRLQGNSQCVLQQMPLRQLINDWIARTNRVTLCYVSNAICWNWSGLSICCSLFLCRTSTLIVGNRRQTYTTKKERAFATGMFMCYPCHSYFTFSASALYFLFLFHCLWQLWEIYTAFVLHAASYEAQVWCATAFLIKRTERESSLWR